MAEAPCPQKEPIVDVAKAPCPQKEPLPSTIMYVDRVRSEMLLKFNLLYWGVKYNEIGREDCCVRYSPSLKGSLLVTKSRGSVTVILETEESQAVIQGHVVHRLGKNRKLSQPVLAEELGFRRYKIELPVTLLGGKGNRFLEKHNCLVLCITYGPRRLLNTQVGLHLEEIDQTNSFMEAYTKRLFTDFIIRASGEEFHVHKAILAARSIYFHRNMAHNEDEIVLDASPDAAQNVIHYLYSGELPTVTLNELIDIFEISVKLYIPSLMDQCTIYLLDIMNKENAGRIRDAAVRTGVRSLIKAVNMRC